MALGARRQAATRTTTFPSAVRPTVVIGRLLAAVVVATTALPDVEGVPVPDAPAIQLRAALVLVAPVADGRPSALAPVLLGRRPAASATATVPEAAVLPRPAAVATRIASLRASVPSGPIAGALTVREEAPLAAPILAQDLTGLPATSLATKATPVSAASIPSTAEAA